MIFNDVPHGKIEAVAYEIDVPVSYIRWAPGTGFVYQIVATSVPDAAACRLGGPNMVSLECAGTFVSGFFGYVGLWHETFVQEHFNNNGCGRMNDKEVLLYAALLNWTLGYGAEAKNYAAECWDRAVG